MSIEKFNSPQHIESAEKFDRKALVSSIGKAAYELDSDTVALIVGDDEWDVREFAPKLELWAEKESTTQDVIERNIALLQEIKAVEGSDIEGKDDKIKALAEQLWS